MQLAEFCINILAQQDVEKACNPTRIAIETNVQEMFTTSIKTMITVRHQFQIQPSVCCNTVFSNHVSRPSNRVAMSPLLDRGVHEKGYRVAMNSQLGRLGRGAHI